MTRQPPPGTTLEAVTVRFAGDSGDGMQLAGTQLTNTSALAGNDVATFPDYPAEIRAPRGTLAGVSGFQVQFASRDVFTPGDALDALVAMNPAGLRSNLADLRAHGILLVDEDSFDDKSLKLAGYSDNPLDDGSLDGYQLLRAPITRLTREAVEASGLGRKLATRCRNFFAMGVVYWLYGRSLEPTERFISRRFADVPEVADADRRALRAGWHFGETIEAIKAPYHVPPAHLPSGRYRNITGNQALAYGLVAAAERAGRDLFYGSYPITPASDILHALARLKAFGVRTFQAEDEIAAMGAVIGAAFGGALGVTASSGPGIALKAEAMGLGVMLELPMIIIDVQRAGPSTGMPTKPEQSDLLQVLHGRSGESPLPVLAARSPADCFEVAIEAARIALRLMTPVVVLSDAYVANGAEPWRIPRVDSLPDLRGETAAQLDAGTLADPFAPYARDALLSRPWSVPGTPGHMHRIGGLEKQDGTGNISYDPDNHAHMVRVRAQKVANAAGLFGTQTVQGPPSGSLLLVSWGGTYGAVTDACRIAQAGGHDVAHVHLRHLNPLPDNLGELLSRYTRVLVAELNSGQLCELLRARYLVDADALGQVRGRPFSSGDVLARIQSLCHEIHLEACR